MAIEKLHIDFFLNKLVKVLLFGQVEPMSGYFIKSKTDTYSTNDGTIIKSDENIVNNLTGILEEYEDSE